MSVTPGELWRLRLNFSVMMTLIFFNSLSFVMILPTLHQYVTNPTAVQMNGTSTSTQNKESYPGLGESELLYSFTVTFYSIGSIVASPLTGFLSLCLPYISILLAGVLMHTVANLLYGLASQGWMLIVSRFLLGASFKFFRVATLTYISNKESKYIKAYMEHVNKPVKKKDTVKKKESEDVSKRTKPPKKIKVRDIQIKKNAVILVSLSTFLPALFGPGISSIVAQIPSAHLFRWIGYFNAICGVFLTVLVFASFHGEYRANLSNLRKGKQHIFSCCKMKKKDMKFTRTIVLLFLLSSYCVWKIGLEMLHTIFNPVLSDSFGLTVKETSYYFTVLLIVYSLGSLLVLIANNVFKLFHPRLVYIGVFITFIVGSSLIADWQTLGKDRCHLFSPYHQSNNSILSCQQYKSSTLHSYCMEVQTAESSNWTIKASELCQATQGCRWNQFSVITNSLCTNCPAICRNVHQSLNIIQYSLGALLFVLAIPAGDICVWILVSNNLQDHEQGPFIGIANGIAGVVGTISPIWIDALYERFHKRTVVAMYIVLCTIALIGLLILYRVLDPRESKSKVKIKGEDEQSLVEN